MSTPDRLLRLPEVVELTGLSSGTIYRQRRAGKFPEPVPISTQAVAWLSSEVDDWIAARVSERDNKSQAKV